MSLKSVKGSWIHESRDQGDLFYELPLPLAVLGHEGGTVLVSLNGLRLLGYRYRG